MSGLRPSTRSGMISTVPIAAGVAGLLLVVVALVRAPEDALEDRVTSELTAFTDWLDENDARGFIGEVGWPSGRADAAQWDKLARAWFDRADQAGLGVTAWATGEWWGDDYALAPYAAPSGEPGVSAARPQARVLEAHLRDGPLRGVSVAGGEFGAPSVEPTSAFSNSSSGTHGTEYHFDGAATFQYLESRGIEVVRIPFRWERLQPELGAPLDAEELGLLRGVVGAAHDAGLEVILDMHNYGAYYLSDGTRGVRRTVGSAEVPIAAFAEVWGRISLEFKDDPGVVGYGLMNEPTEMQPVDDDSPAEVWEAASQEAVQRIRSNGDDKLIAASGYHWSSVQEWWAQHPDGWIEDPAHNFVYEAHHYWDPDHSGSYKEPYAAAAAAARGDRDVVVMIGVPISMAAIGVGLLSRRRLQLRASTPAPRRREANLS